MLAQGKVLFRRIGGRIVPILERHPNASGVALLTASSLAGMKIRQKAVEAYRGKGKQGTGSLAANFLIDTGISSGLTFSAYKFGGPAVRNSLEVTQRFLKRVLRGY